LKIRTKITLLFTLVVTGILLAVSSMIYSLTSIESKEVFRKRLRSRASNNAQVFDFSGGSAIEMLKRIDAGTLSLLPQKTVLIADTGGQVLYRYEAEDAGHIEMDQPLLSAIIEGGEIFFRTGDRAAIGLYYRGQRRQFIIIVAARDVDGELRLLQLKNILFITLALATLVTVIVGVLFSSQLIRPIVRIIEEVKNISSRNLSRRLQTGMSQDELNDLARTFNDLLNRLQDAFNSQRRFISNASHELSTPLTSVSSQLQVTLQKDRPPEEYRRVLRSIQEDIEQLQQLTRSLLEIAKTSGSGSIELAEVRIDEILLKIVSDIGRINSDYVVELVFPDPPEDEKDCMVFGNSDLLYIAIKNIIENGCKYSPDKRSVVTIDFETNNIVVTVTNQGDVISEEEIEQIFQPFYRGTVPTEVKGFGLGLPLARRIISLHKGEITVQSDLSGTRFSIRLPSLRIQH